MGKPVLDAKVGLSGSKHSTRIPVAVNGYVVRFDGGVGAKC